MKQVNGLIGEAHLGHIWKRLNFRIMQVEGKPGGSMG